MSKKGWNVVLLVLIFGLGFFYYYYYYYYYYHKKIAGYSGGELVFRYTKNSQTPQRRNITKRLFGRLKRTPKEVKVPILNYHYIRDVEAQNDPLGFALSVSEENFESQLRLLRDLDYTAVFPQDIYNALTYGRKLPANPIVISFDDGYEDFFRVAYPLLKKYRFKAIVYMITDKIDSPDNRYLTSWQLMKLARSPLITIGSHSKSHKNLSNDKVNIIDEIVTSKKKLERIIGKEVKDFCFPSGFYNKKTLTILRAYGFLTSVTTRNGFVHKKENLLTMPRVRINGKDTLDSFQKKIDTETEGS